MKLEDDGTASISVRCGQQPSNLRDVESLDHAPDEGVRMMAARVQEALERMLGKSEKLIGFTSSGLGARMIVA